VTYTLAGFAALLTEAAAHMPMAQHKALERGAVILETEAKSYPGHYQPGWAPLKAETIARKATGNSPLLETGEMRDSITHNSDDHEAYIGSNSKILIYQELGTSRGIPPRPVLGLAVIKKEKQVVEETGRIMVGSLKLL
jgi:phage gpG-like protein